jgi:rhomboid family GlyGly-CTERM serine protease
MLQIKHLPVQRIHIISPLIVLVLAFIAFVFDEQIANTLIYNRGLVSNGEYWRLISGHFLHTNDNHFMLNAAAIVLLWALHGQYYNHKNYLIVFITSAIVCGLGIHWFSLDITLYVGLSGALHGFFVWGALMDIKHQEKTGYLLLLGVILKIAHEQFYGASADVESFIESSVATDAHMYGAIGGLLAFLICTFFNGKIKTNNA